MLNMDEELGCLQILIDHFPSLEQQGLVIGLYEFLQPDLNYKKYICNEKTVKEVAAEYILKQMPYIILDESEGYKCIFFKGNTFKAQYDATNAKMVHFVETRTA